MGGKEGGLWRLSAASRDAGRRTALGIQGWVRDWDTSARDSPLGLSNPPVHLWAPHPQAGFFGIFSFQCQAHTWTPLAS